MNDDADAYRATLLNRLALLEQERDELLDELAELDESRLLARLVGDDAAEVG